MKLLSKFSSSQVTEMTSQWLLLFTDLGWVSGYVLLIKDNRGPRTLWVVLCHEGYFKQTGFTFQLPGAISSHSVNGSWYLCGEQQFVCAAGAWLCWLLQHLVLDTQSYVHWWLQFYEVEGLLSPSRENAGAQGVIVQLLSYKFSWRHWLL